MLSRGFLSLILVRMTVVQLYGHVGGVSNRLGLSGLGVGEGSMRYDRTFDGLDRGPR